MRRFDEFWFLKNAVYRFLINSPFGVLADGIARSWAEENASTLSTSDALADERTFKRRHRSLFRALANARAGFYDNKSAISTTSTAVVPRRDFIVDERIALNFPGDLTGRYTQSKVMTRALQAVAPAAKLPLGQTIFEELA